MNIAEKLTTIAQNEQLVADANAELEEALYSKSEGGKSYYDAFWDAFQQNGNRVEYQDAFARRGWNATTFKPKYNMQPTTAERMFYRFDEGSNGPSIDLAARLDECGVTLDFSKATSFSYCFQNAQIKRIGVVDVTGCPSLTAIFINTYWLNTIDKLIIAEHNTFDSNSFNNSAISNLTVEGVIGSTINFQWSPLTKASMTSVINALSSSTSGKTATFKKTAKEAAFTASEWDALISTKPNWTISLV